MEDIDKMGAKLEEILKAKQSAEGKTEELEKETQKSFKAFEETYEKKRIQLEEEYIKNKKKLNQEHKDKKDKILNDMNKLETELISLTNETYKRVIILEFDRKRSVDIYDPKKSQILDTLKKFIKENPNLPQKYVEKIEALYSKKKSIDDLMYEYT